MILNGNFVDSNIISMIANFFIETEQVDSTLSLQSTKTHSSKADTLSINHQWTCYTSQKIPANREKIHPILLIVLFNNKYRSLA